MKSEIKGVNLDMRGEVQRAKEIKGMSSSEISKEVEKKLSPEELKLAKEVEFVWLASEVSELQFIVDEEPIYTIPMSYSDEILFELYFMDHNINYER